MPIVNGYADLALLKTRLDVAGTGQDAVLEAVIEAASRAIDGFTNRRFYTVTETRHYTGEFGDLLFVDDLVSVTTLKTDADGDRTYETTWLTTDYDLEPFNASLTSRPYTQLRTTPNGTQSFPSARKGVEIVGSWGWPAVPDAINEATLIQATRLVKRPTVPFGIETVPELGVLQRLSSVDPDVSTLVAPFRRMTIGAV